MMRYKTYFLLVPAAAVALSAAALLLWGLKPGIDLTGGSLLQVSYTASSTPTTAQVEQAVVPLNFGEVRVQPTGANGYSLRSKALTNDQKDAMESALGALGPLHEDEFTSVSPTIGAELLDKGLIALGLVAVCIILFIAFAFRHVSKPVASWKYGVIAIVTLGHDVIVPTGLFALLGHVAGAEVDSLFIVGLLTILGISINDTIVVFDRIRENLTKTDLSRKQETFADVVGRSVRQTLARSINTSLTVIIVLVALYILGPATTRDFALTLIVGMVAGTYSSILLAAPLLVLWERTSRARNK
jgi:preprotein translocase subunit SecF